MVMTTLAIIAAIVALGCIATVFSWSSGRGNTLPLDPAPSVREQLEQTRLWLQRKHMALKNGMPARLVTIEPDVAALAMTLEYNAWLNTAATESRWEVVHIRTGAMACGNDPNETYRKCAQLVAEGKLR